MPSFNKVIIMGNLVRDPELRYTPSGQAVADIRIAINRRRRTSGGQTQQETTFVDITAWGRHAETISQRFSKSDPIFIEGRLARDEHLLVRHRGRRLDGYVCSLLGLGIRLATRAEREDQRHRQKSGCHVHSPFEWIVSVRGADA